MAETHANNASTTPPPVDPITAFWRDMWARSTAGAQGMGAMGGMPGMPGMPGMGQGDAAAFMTPEAMRRMQGAFLEAMAQYAEQYMRSPQFLESMKKSMGQAMQFRQQMDDFLKSNMSSAFESATGGANSEILGAIRQSTEQIQAKIAKIEERVADLETAVTGKPAAGAKKKTTKR
ncbi:MAG: hypothetical protein ACREJO_01000 [Phycisphaerales bacterium]